MSIFHNEHVVFPRSSTSSNSGGTATATAINYHYFIYTHYIYIYIWSRGAGAPGVPHSHWATLGAYNRYGLMFQSQSTTRCRHCVWEIRSWHHFSSNRAHSRRHQNKSRNRNCVHAICLSQTIMRAEDRANTSQDALAVLSNLFLSVPFLAIVHTWDRIRALTEMPPVCSQNRLLT